MVKTDFHSYNRRKNQRKPRIITNATMSPILYSVKCCVDNGTSIQERENQRESTPPLAIEPE